MTHLIIFLNYTLSHFLFLTVMLQHGHFSFLDNLILSYLSSVLHWIHLELQPFVLPQPSPCCCSPVFFRRSGWILFSITVTFTGDNSLTLTWAVLHGLLSTACHKLLMVVCIWTHNWLLSHITSQWGHLETISEGPEPSVSLWKEGILGDMFCKKLWFWI